jgi:hypothetical protein
MLVLLLLGRVHDASTPRTAPLANGVSVDTYTISLSLGPLYADTLSINSSPSPLSSFSPKTHAFALYLSHPKQFQILAGLLR